MCSQEPTFSSFFFYAGCNIWFWLKCSQACAAKEKSHETFCLLPIQDLSVRSRAGAVSRVPSSELGARRSSRRTHNECQAKPERRGLWKMHYNAACQPTWTWTRTPPALPVLVLLHSGLHWRYVTNVARTAARDSGQLARGIIFLLI